MSVKNKVTRISRCIIYRVIFHSKRSFYLLFPFLQAKTPLLLLRRTEYHSSVWYFWSIGLNFNTKTAFMDGQDQCKMTVYIHFHWNQVKKWLFWSIYFPLPWLYDALKQPLTDSLYSAAPYRLRHFLSGCYFRMLRVDWLQIKQPWNSFLFTRVWRPLHHQLALFWDHRYVRYSEADEADGALSQSTLAPQSITGRCWNSRSFVLII